VGAPDELAGFAPTPALALPFPSIVVASSDDPWISLSRARSLAAQWGSHFADIGAQGHINAASGIGDWAEGQAMLNGLVDVTTAGLSPAAMRASLATTLSEVRAGT
jgi:predicted alpha/beta hydrolase family esterase